MIFEEKLEEVSLIGKVALYHWVIPASHCSDTNLPVAQIWHNRLGPFSRLSGPPPPTGRPKIGR